MKKLNESEIKDFLEAKYEQYNCKNFINSDPIQIPHRFSTKNDIEIAAFLTAIIAWGKRNMIIKNAVQLMELMDNSPYHFISSAGEPDLERLHNFTHRTFNGTDCVFFIRSLQNIYKNHGGLEQVFEKKIKEGASLKDAMIYFRQIFFEIPYPPRTSKHIANVQKNSAAKRINMFLMWMIRNDDKGVHFGLWQTIKPVNLFIPLDVHTGNISRKLGLLHRKQNDWKAVEELTARLRNFDPIDPVKYDFALFGLGVFENF